MGNSKKSILTFADRLQGDKTVWIIVLMLMLFSIVCSFSSTSRLLEGDSTRLDMVWRQLKTVAGGLAVILVCYNIKNIRLFRWLSRWGFIFSAILLVILASHAKLGFVKAVEINNAWRIIQFGSLSVHVFEIVKLVMPLYLAWAVDAFKKGELKLGNTQEQKKIIYIFVPFVTVFVLVLLGSTSSALIIGAIMFIIIVLGIGGFKEIGILIASGLLVLGLALGIHKITGGEHFRRIGTAVSRTFQDENWADSLANARFGSPEYHRALDELRQPESAKIAIKEGGLLGKGAGQSTQKYVVPDVSEDYMFSFLIEEYGLVGALLIILLYSSLLARGSLIVRNCGKDIYAKLVVAGLTLTISLQAFLHICVNAGIGIMTGQTLPMISHGTGAFLCFSAAFGIILSFSRVAHLRMQREAEKLEAERRMAEETAAAAVTGGVAEGEEDGDAEGEYGETENQN